MYFTAGHRSMVTERTLGGCRFFFFLLLFFFYFLFFEYTGGVGSIVFVCLSVLVLFCGLACLFEISSMRPKRAEEFFFSFFPRLLLFWTLLCVERVGRG